MIEDIETGYWAVATRSDDYEYERLEDAAPYTVIHRFHETSDILSPVAFEETEQFAALVGTEVRPEAKNYTVYAPAETYSQEITADGSVEFIYDYRKYELDIRINTNGGVMSVHHSSDYYVDSEGYVCDATGRDVMVLSYGDTLPAGGVLDVNDVKYIKLAEKFGAGNSVINEDNIINLNDPQNAGKYPKPSGTVASLVKNIHENSACSACYASLVRALYVNSKGRREDIYIGQGWKDSKIPDSALGIGNCCKNAVRNVKGCPPSAKDIEENF